MAASVPLTHHSPGGGCACKLPQQLLDDVLGTLRTSAAPADLDTELVAEVLRGGAETVTEVGALLAGGHSIVDPAPKYGLAVVGEVSHDAILRKGGGRPGDRLMLTKPLGVGVISTAVKRGQATGTQVDDAVVAMTRLNAAAARAAVACGVAGRAHG